MSDARPTPSSPPPPGTGSRGLLTLACVVAVAAAALALVVRLGREHDRVHAERDARARELAAGPHVLVAPVETSTPSRDLVRLGEVRPYVETALYAKVSGYLREVRVDRGAVVHEGDVLAVIDVPETAPQLAAAQADAANRHAIAARARALAAPGIVSQQEADVAQTSAALADATTRVLGIGREYRLVRAPFDGVVTARFADPGALVQAATSSQTGALPIVRVSDVAHVRIFVYLDQRDAAFVRVGDEASVRVRERPGTELPTRVARIAGELDTRTRSELVELDVDNAAALLPVGGFVDVALHVTTPSWPQVPAEALIVRGARTFVAVVDGAARVHLVPVEVVDDDGTNARVRGPVTAGQRVALSVGEEIADGSLVQPSPRPVERARR